MGCQALGCLKPQAGNLLQLPERSQALAAPGVSGGQLTGKRSSSTLARRRPHLDTCSPDAERPRRH